MLYPGSHDVTVSRDRPQIAELNHVVVSEDLLKQQNIGDSEGEDDASLQ